MLGRKQQRASRAEKAVLSDARADFKTARCLASEQQDWQAALPLFSAVLKAVQDQCHYWAGRGDCLQALGQYEDAYHDYSAAVRISPSRSVPVSFLMWTMRHDF
eukprot:2454-Heterococcus_DN1.PRE.2